MQLKELLTAKPVSIYCFVNDQDKKIFIAYSIETIPSVLFNLKKLLPELEGDANKLELRIIETYNTKHPLYLKWRVDEFYKECKDTGYRLYTSYKALQWTLEIGVGVGSDHTGGAQYKAIVKLRTSKNVVHDVLVCDTMEEAKEFVQSNTIATIVRLL